MIFLRKLTPFLLFALRCYILFDKFLDFTSHELTIFLVVFVHNIQ